MREKFIAVLCILSMALMLSMSGGVWAAEDTIKIADIDPLSGTFKDIGDRFLDGTKYAVEEINRNGGLLGKKVELIPVDSEWKPDVAARKAQNLILKDGVKFFHGGSGSAIGTAMAQLAAKQNVIFFTSSMEAASMTGEKCNRNFFRVCANTDTHSFSLAVLVAKQGFKKVAIIAQDYSYGKEAVDAFKRKLKQVSPAAKVVVELYHPAQNKDYAPYVSQIISAKPDIIFTPNWGNDLSLFLKQGRPMGMNQKVISYYINDEVTIQALGNDSYMIGNMGSENYSVSIPLKKNKEFVERFKKDRGYYPTWLRGKSYMAVMFWAEAVKKAGTTDVAAVIKAWEGLTYDGPAGVWTMRACDHQAQLPLWFTEIVEKNPYFNHAFEKYTGMATAESVSVPCEDTGCKMK